MNRRLSTRGGFTLIELLITIAIIGMLVTLMAPNLGSVLDKANSAKCAANLRGIVGAVQLYAQDNDNRYPKIEAMPSGPVYPAGEASGTLLGVLSPYGVTETTLKCPADMREKNPRFKTEGSSYMWRPMVDDELVDAAKFYGRGQTFVVPLKRLSLVSDFINVHDGRMNVGFADGHVRMY
jgi:prepilin-type N-terminal cleavage/methylation domain-containing protein/prepilin-type processing-associated H-X9-DG protein